MRRMMGLQGAKDVAMGCGAYDLEVSSNIAACAKVLYEKGDRLGKLTTTTPDEWTAVSLWHRPSPMGKKIDDKKYEKAVVSKLASHQDASPEKLLSLCMPLPLFGAQHFRVESSESQWPPLVIMAINFYGVYLLALNTREELAHFPLMSILGWSSTPVRVLLRVKLAKKQGGITNMTCRFKTQTPRMAKEICGVLLLYAHEMMKAIQIQKAN